jgi:hypothetical protein
MIWRADGEAELYNLKEDPSEAVNLIERKPGAVEELNALKALVSARTRKIGGAGKRRRIDPELQKQLEALGYLKEERHPESRTQNPE